MKIALLGYGKMGQTVDQAAQERGHEIVARIQKEELGVKLEELHGADVCIDFSHPDAVLKHIGEACEYGTDLVIGTTDWEDHMDAAKSLVAASGIGAIYSPNFSVSTHLFARLTHEAAHLFSHIEGYDVAGFEIHHNQKDNSPSGTGKMLAEDLCDAFNAKKKPEYNRTTGGIDPGKLHFASVRCGSMPGTHTILFDSPFDTIELTMRARSREGWGIGALMAAEWVHGRKGFFTMEDVLDTLLKREVATV